MQATPSTNQASYRLIQAIFNPIARTVLRSPLHGLLDSQLLVISFTGRKSGKLYNIPIGYARLDADALLIGVGGSWWKNLRGGAKVKVALKGKVRSGMTEVVTGEEEAADLYTHMLAQTPTQARFAHIKAEADGRPNREDLRRALQGGFALVKIHLQ
ncbi:nitroreductase/quinone reductase family protein [Ktedonospora formicarum]|uniref:Nitroreductase family deazaflavin-dependent oxidoreductase n=1 Tax=Ktedonospora formicarum TaxID=2778364 RepID=A0A8J3MUD1_9CHLR|nr:nitroreductase/quinone reductase family protein [Ktedonospora formicarum]GHO48085.1 hypothetical protein KSX_62480 [Ktedonospora formicarum]